MMAVEQTIPLMTFHRCVRMPYRCPYCGRMHVIPVSWDELSDIIDGGSLEVECSGCDKTVELSRIEVVR